MKENRVVKRIPNNASGKFFTTEDCDGCAYCASVAPANFDYEKSTNQYFVCRQPATAQEEDLLREASDDCPLDAIRVDRHFLRFTIGEPR